MASALCVERAAAQPSGVLAYERADPSCPDEDWLRTEVMNRLGADPFAGSPGVVVEVRVEATARGRRARLRLRERDGRVLGERELTSREADCRALGSTLALAVAVALDELGDADRAPSPEPAAPTPSATSQDRDDPARAGGSGASDERPALDGAGSPDVVDPGSSPAAGASVRARLGLGLGVSFGPHPDAAALAVGSVGLRFDAFSVELELRAASETGARNDAGVGVTTSSAGALLPCAHVAWLALCGVVGVGHLRAEGRGVDAPAVAEVWSPFLGGAARLEWALEPWLLARLTAEVDVPLVQPRLELDGATLWSAPPVLLASVASLVVELP